MKSIKIILFGLLFVSQCSVAQSNEEILKDESRKSRSHYSGISLMGLGMGNFRDLATSPLTYAGLSLSSSRFSLRINQYRETMWGATLAFGFFLNNFNNHNSSSLVVSPSIYYSELYEVPKISTKKFNVKVGGMLNITSNIRSNAGLNNNALGLEIIPTLFGSIKGTLDISRNAVKSKKFLFIKYTLQKRRRNIAFRLNTGIINASVRNGYVYSGQSALLNEPKLFDDYQFNIFSGYRLSSSIDYTLYSRKTTNAVQLSYVWDAYKTGGEFDTFQMAQHALRFTLLFHTK